MRTFFTFLFVIAICAHTCAQGVSVCYKASKNKEVKILGKNVLPQIKAMVVDDGQQISPAEVYTFQDNAIHKVQWIFKDSTQVPKDFVKEIKEITSVEFSSSINIINEEAFSGCKGIKELFLPDNILHIHKCAFENCQKIEKLRISENLLEFEFAVFSGCKSIKQLEIPSSIQKIGDCAFHECEGIEKVEIPSSVTEILEDAFSGCIGMTELEIANSVTFIGDFAFYGCKSLVNVTIPYSVKWIGDYAFKNCEELSISVSSAVTQFGKEVFEGCKGEVYHP